MEFVDWKRAEMYEKLNDFLILRFLLNFKLLSTSGDADARPPAGGPVTRNSLLLAGPSTVIYTGPRNPSPDQKSFDHPPNPRKIKTLFWAILH